MVGCTCQGQAAPFCRMAQHDPTIVGIADTWMEHAAHNDSRLPWVFGIAARRLADLPPSPKRSRRRRPR